MKLYDVMRTTFACREFEPDPVPDEILQRIVEHARFITYMPQKSRNSSTIPASRILRSMKSLVRAVCCIAGQRTRTTNPPAISISIMTRTT